MGATGTATARPTHREVRVTLISLSSLDCGQKVFVGQGRLPCAVLCSAECLSYLSFSVYDRNLSLCSLAMAARARVVKIFQFSLAKVRD
jgi:hypothetical protein